MFLPVLPRNMLSQASSGCKFYCTVGTGPDYLQMMNLKIIFKSMAFSINSYLDMICTLIPTLARLRAKQTDIVSPVRPRLPGDVLLK